MKNVVVLSGSIREGRKSHFVAQLIAEKLNENTTVAATLLDLRDYPLPIMEMRIDDVDELPKGLRAFNDLLSQAHGIVIVSPEYKNGIPGALKNALDYLNPQIFKRTPLGIATVSSGGFGGVNCLSQLRLVGLALGGMPISETLCVSKVNEVFDKNGNLTDNSFSEKTTQFVESFMWVVERLSS